MSLTTDDMILIEQRVANERKSAGAAYLLWFFLGFVSAHRFYLGKPISAILQILSYFVLIGFVWWFLDFFLIPSIIEDGRCQWWLFYSETLLLTHHDPPATERPWPLSPKEVGSTCVTTR